MGVLLGPDGHACARCLIGEKVLLGPDGGIQYAKDMGKKFILWLPKAANVSKPLKSAIDNKEVIRKNIPKGKKTS